MHERGVPAVLAVSDDAQHTSRGFVPEVGADALQTKELPLRLRALGQIVDGKLTAPATQVVPLASSANMIERRMALRALAKMKAPETHECAQRGLDVDPENGVRCAAALAFADLPTPSALQPLLRAVAGHGNHMLVECAVIALRRLQPFPAVQLAHVVSFEEGARVREIAMRAMAPFGSQDFQPISAALAGEDRFAGVAAAEALGNVRRVPGAVPVLLATLDHQDPAVAARGAVSLGVIAARNEPELAAQRPAMLESSPVLSPAMATRASGPRTIGVIARWEMRCAPLARKARRGSARCAISGTTCAWPRLPGACSICTSSQTRSVKPRRAKTRRRTRAAPCSGTRRGALPSARLRLHRLK